MDCIISFIPMTTESNGISLIRIGEAAEYLGVSKSTVYRMVEQGILTPSKTPGGQRRFNTEELDDYLKRSVSLEAPASQSSRPEREAEAPKVDPRNQLNDLTGREWMPATKSYMFQRGLGANHPDAAIERQHPAPYSFQDIQTLVEFFTKKGMTVLDPFGGVGSTAKACALSGRKCISIELQQKWHELAIQRLETEVSEGASKAHCFLQGDSREILKTLANDSVDFVVTSPPYWSILNKKADHKVKVGRIAQNLATNYSDDDPHDLASIRDYDEFNDSLVNEFIVPAAECLKTSKYLCLVVSDFRDKSKFVSFHSDLIQLLDGKEIGENSKLTLQGTKILLQNHKSLLPYGYPFAYVENIHHQYILIFRKVKK